jgi:outer membrane protein insertion porin family
MEIIEAIRIQGSRSVSEETYLFHLQSKVGTPLTGKQVLADYQRLWKTGFLDDLTLEMTDGEKGRGADVLHHRTPSGRRIEFTGSDALGPTSIEEKLREEGRDPGRIVLRPRASLEGGEGHPGPPGGQGFPEGDVKVEGKTLDDTSVAVVFDLREKDTIRIREIWFEGAEVFPQWRLRAGMKNRKNPWLAFASKVPSWLGAIVATGGEVYSEDKLSEELEKLRELYLNNGFVDVSFASRRLEYEDGWRRFLLWKRPQRWVQVAIPIHEGPQYRVGGVSVEGERLPREDGDVLPGSRDG